MPQSNLDNYYRILGVTVSSSKTDIKKAFMRLSLKHHPDKIRGNEKREPTPYEISFFTQLKDAYEVLSSDDKIGAARNRAPVGDANPPPAAPPPTRSTVRAAPTPAAPPIRRTATAASTTAPPPPRSTTTATPTAAAPHTRVPPHTRTPSIDSTSSDDSASAHSTSYWASFTAWLSGSGSSQSNVPIIDRIVFAVFAKKIRKLKELLIEYRNVSAAERSTHIPKLNWLLVEAAAAHDNEIALILTKFGADVNHYGEFMKLADDQSFDCYFADMLIHLNNFELFAQILDQVDLTIYSVGLYMANNWPNSHLHHYPKYPWGAERYVENPNDEYEHNCRKRLLWCAIFCAWVLQHDRPDILAVLKDVSTKAYKAKLGSCYFGDGYRFLADQTLRVVAAKSFTTERIINRFIAVEKNPRIWRFLSNMQVKLDMHVNIYTSSLSPLCVMPGANNLERLMYFNEMLNAINTDVDPIRKAVAWHLSYYKEYGGPALLFISLLGIPFALLATDAYFACGSDNPPCEMGKTSSVFWSYAIGGFPLYIITTALAARILSLGCLEIGGTLDSVINRAAINLVINEHAAQQAAKHSSPFVGFSFRSRAPTTVDPDADAEDNDHRAYHSFNPGA